MSLQQAYQQQMILQDNQSPDVPRVLPFSQYLPLLIHIYRKWFCYSQQRQRQYHKAGAYPGLPPLCMIQVFSC